MRGFGASRPPKPPAAQQRLSSPGSSPALQLRGRNLAQAKCGGPISEDTHGAWSPHTVEIQAEDGEVFALRPCGEVLALKPKDTARQALPSLQEVLLEREMKTVKTVKAPDAAGRHTTETTKTTETGKELPDPPTDRADARARPSPGRPRKAACAGSTDIAAVPEALAAAVAQLVDAANVVAAAARKTDKTQPLDGDAERPKSTPSKPPLMSGPKVAASPGKGPLSKGLAEPRTPERLARRSQSAAPAEARGGALREAPRPCQRVKSSSESPGARARNSLMSKYADLDHVLVLPSEAMQWCRGRFEEDKSPQAPEAVSSESSLKDDLQEVLANALSPQRTIRIEAMGSSASQADNATASMPNDASCDSLATRLAQLSPQQRLALQELLKVAEFEGKITLR